MLGGRGAGETGCGLDRAGKVNLATIRVLAQSYFNSPLKNVFEESHAKTKRKWDARLRGHDALFYEYRPQSLISLCRFTRSNAPN